MWITKMHDTFSVVMAHSSPFYFQNADGSGYSGVDTCLIAALSQALRLNFSVWMSPVRSWGSCTTDNCTGMIGMLQRNEYDVAMSGMSMTYNRQKQVDFTFPYLVDRLTFVVRAPRPLDPAGAITKPFSVEVWVALFAVVVALMVIRQVARLLPPYFHDFPGLLEIHEVLLGKGLLQLPKLFSQRIILCSWLSLSLVLSTSYTGVLFSSMTHSGLEDVVNSIPKLTKALVNKEVVCGALKNTHLENSLQMFLSLSRDKARPDCMEFDKIQKEIIKLQQDKPLRPFAEAILSSLESGTNYVTSDTEGLERCQKGGFAYIGDYIGILADAEDITALTFAEDSFQMGLYGIAIKRQLNISGQFNQVIIHLWDAGLVEFWLANVTYKPRRAVHELGPEVLHLKDMAGAFNILWGLSASVAALCIESSISFFRARGLDFNSKSPKRHSFV